MVSGLFHYDVDSFKHATQWRKVLMRPLWRWLQLIGRNIGLWKIKVRISRIYEEKVRKIKLIYEHNYVY